MIRSAITSAHHDERGGVLFIVAVTLFVLLGMLVLTVDLGRGVAFRRQVVTGTDAAALAAAQQCALNNGSAAARTAAAAVLTENVELPHTHVIDVPAECDDPGGTAPKYVTVTTTADIEYFFAPIFGVASGDIATRSTAMWAAAELNPVPIMIDREQLATNCNVFVPPPDPENPPPPNEECELEYDKDALGEPSWGTLGLPWWGDRDAWRDPQQCSMDADTLKTIIAQGGYDQTLELSEPKDGSVPTYVCVDNGLSDSVWSELENGTFIFPVIDVDTSEGYIVPPNSVPDPPTERYCTGADIEALNAQRKDCKIHTVNVVGWVLLHVTNTGNHGATITVETVTDVRTGGWVGSGHVDIGIRQVRLVD
jgi:Flp pilus assembly protein TadG